MARPQPKAAPAVPAEPSVIAVDYDGHTHRITIKRIGTARRLSLRVRNARQDVVLTMPSHASLIQAERFARRHAAWIAERLGALTPTIPLEPGCRVPLRGVPHRAERRPGLRRRVWTEAEDDEPVLCVNGPPALFGVQLIDFLREQARADLTKAVAHHAATVRTKIKGITLRDTRSRWGSCSSQGSLNFSWRLIMAPHNVLDYLAAHEVAHRVHLNHSDQFWQLVRQLDPAYEVAEAWLKAHGADLHRYVAADGT